jgi:hypothetical protein
MEQWWWQHIYYVPKISVNRASITHGVAWWKMHGLCGNITSQTPYQLRFEAKTLATTSLLSPKNEHQRSLNNFGAVS